MSPTNHHNSLYINSRLKRNIDVLQTRLVCNQKKPSLQPKQALFTTKRSLVCKPPIFIMIGKANKWNWQGKRHERREASR